MQYSCPGMELEKCLVRLRSPQSSGKTIKAKQNQQFNYWKKNSQDQINSSRDRGSEAACVYVGICMCLCAFVSVFAWDTS